MAELRLKFKDANGEAKRIPVSKEKFAVGRHSSNDLSLPIEKLSREHLIIERTGDDFTAADIGSSNGTEINGVKLENPTRLNNGDRLNLGGGLEIEIEISSDDALSDPEAQPAAEESGKVNAAAPANNSGVSASSTSASGFPTSIFYIAPILVVVLLVFVGGMIYVFSSGGKDSSAKKDDDFIYSSRRDKDVSSPEKDRDVPVNRNNSLPAAENSSSTGNENSVISASSPGSRTESAKIEQNAAAFLRRIAQNDPKAFVTGDQALKLGEKIKQFSGSASLADNIRSANKNAAQIRTLAAAKNLKPQFLAAAALAKLGNSRGDVLQTTQGMSDVLDKLGMQIGNELADDALVMIAAYDQGQAGDFLKMRNMLQELATKSSESSRAIRTIWFLQKQGKITDGEFEFALRFLAIGTVMQNPKDFGVNAEALNL